MRSTYERLSESIQSIVIASIGFIGSGSVRDVSGGEGIIWVALWISLGSKIVDQSTFNEWMAGSSLFPGPLPLP